MLACAGGEFQPLPINTIREVLQQILLLLDLPILDGLIVRCHFELARGCDDGQSPRNQVIPGEPILDDLNAARITELRNVLPEHNLHDKSLP